MSTVGRWCGVVRCYGAGRGSGDGVAVAALDLVWGRRQKETTATMSVVEGGDGVKQIWWRSVVVGARRGWRRI